MLKLRALFFFVRRFPLTANLPLRKRAPLSLAGFQEEETRGGGGAQRRRRLFAAKERRANNAGCDFVFFATSCRDRNLFEADRVIIRLLCREKFY